MILLHQVGRNVKRYAVTVAILYHANDALTHACDMVGFYHKEKHSTLACYLV